MPVSNLNNGNPTPNLVINSTKEKSKLQKCLPKHKQKKKLKLNFIYIAMKTIRDLTSISNTKKLKYISRSTNPKLTRIRTKLKS